ncbi:MAG: FRG domain-containing protein [Candidatus Electrothrix sp. AW1]|nr:FRG domain-containing protein [Candidatus Electrothrix sp. AX1]MCI5181244.1 FRG domain-containing protein [Candidatus Electrothrix gigas]
MKTLSIKSPEELIEKINSFPNHYIYRGHSNSSWFMQTTLERGAGAKFSKEFAEKYERYSKDEFLARFHLYDKENVSPKTLLEWLSIMQHYGVPTRLLDFTTSPYAALYFSLETYDTSARPDIALFCIDYTALMEKSLCLIADEDNNFKESRDSIRGKQDEIFDEFVDRFNRNILWVTEPQRLNARIDRQAGCFLVSGNKGRKIVDLTEAEEYKEVEMLKICYPGDQIESIFALLRKMNISGKSIYGDLNGLAKSLALDLKIYAA